MTRDPLPGSALIHPVTLTSLSVLVLNDHFLKGRAPGFLTGKLSDFAGLVVLPLFFHAAFELFYARLRGRCASDAASNRALGVSLAVALLAFALPEVSERAEAAYCLGMGILEWPFRALYSLITECALPALRPVGATADTSDLLALPMGAVAWRIGARGPRAPRRTRAHSSALATASVLLIALVAPHATARSDPWMHDGLYFSGEAGGGLLLLDSTGSISNGFRQKIPSSAQGLAPLLALELGGTIERWVLGARFLYSRVNAPVISTLGDRFTLPGRELNLLGLEATGKYYPDPAKGLHFGAGLGFSSIEGGAWMSQFLRGGCVSLEAGHGLWLARQWSVGARFRILGGIYRGERVDTTTTLLMPALTLTITLH